MKAYVITLKETYEYYHQNDWGGYDSKPDNTSNFCYALKAATSKEKAIEIVKKEEPEKRIAEKEKYEKGYDYEETDFIRNELTKEFDRWEYSRYVLLEKEYFDDNECGLCDKFCDGEDRCKECYWNRPTRVQVKLIIRATEVEME